MQKANGLDIPLNLEDTLSPERTALIVYDMQVGILRQLPHAQQIVTNVQQVLTSARSAGLRVFFMRHLSLPKEVTGVFGLQMAMRWQRATSVEDVTPWFLRDSPGFPITEELAPLPTDGVFDKITMSTFEGTPLNIALRDCAINSFIIVGVATEIDIEPTVRHGADSGYVQVVVTDACGAGDDEASKRAVESLRFIGDAFLTDVETVCGLLDSGAARSRATKQHYR